MAIPQHTIDQILDRTDIVDLIGQRVKLKKTGRTYSGCCPFHQEKTPSMKINDEHGSFYCFGCGAKGDIFSLYTDLYNYSFLDAVKELSQKAGINLSFQDSKNSFPVACASCLYSAFNFRG